MAYSIPSNKFVFSTIQASPLHMDEKGMKEVKDMADSETMKRLVSGLPEFFLYLIT